MPQRIRVAGSLARPPCKTPQRIRDRLRKIIICFYLVSTERSTSPRGGSDPGRPSASPSSRIGDRHRLRRLSRTHVLVDGGHSRHDARITARRAHRRQNGGNAPRCTPKRRACGVQIVPDQPERSSTPPMTRYSFAGRAFEDWPACPGPQILAHLAAAMWRRPPWRHPLSGGNPFFVAPEPLGHVVDEIGHADLDLRPCIASPCIARATQTGRGRPSSGALGFRDGAS